MKSQQIHEVKTADLNIITPGTFGVFSNFKGVSSSQSPYLYSGSFGSCVGLAMRFIEENKTISVLAHFFASSKTSLNKSLENILDLLKSNHRHTKDNLEDFHCCIFLGETPNSTSKQMTVTLKMLCSSLGAKIQIAKEKYPNVLFNAVTGEIMNYEINPLPELRRRNLLIAAASGDLTKKSSDPLQWNYSANYQSEPLSFFGAKIKDPIPGITMVGEKHGAYQAYCKIKM